MQELERLLRQGREALEIGDYAAAVKKRRQAAPFSQGRQGHFLLGEALVERTVSRGATAWRARDLEPEDLELLYALGDALFEASQPEALQVYEEILRLDRPGGRLGQYRAGAFPPGADGAGGDGLRKALKLEPDSVFALNSLGDACYALGETRRPCPITAG